MRIKNIESTISTYKHCSYVCVLECIYKTNQHNKWLSKLNWTKLPSPLSSERWCCLLSVSQSSNLHKKGCHCTAEAESGPGHISDRLYNFIFTFKPREKIKNSSTWSINYNKIEVFCSLLSFWCNLRWRNINSQIRSKCWLCYKCSYIQSWIVVLQINCVLCLKLCRTEICSNTWQTHDRFH